MKEVFSAFGSEVFRPLVTLLLPGVVGGSTWFIVALRKWRGLYDLVNANHVETGLVLLFAALFIGLILEDLGSLVESRILDTRICTKTGFEHHEEEWYSYLRQAFPVEPVGHRYLKSLVLRMKFELGASWAMIVAAPGIFCTGLSLTSSLVICSILLGATAYLALFEARHSHKNLSRLRREMLKGITIIGQAPRSGT